jgi:signal transduction histidine kinase
VNSRQQTARVPTATGAQLETEGVGRDLGIPAIGKAPWGAHFCQFYGSDQDLLDIIVPYYRAGLENNEKCNWVTCRLEADEVAEALSREVDDLERRVAVGQMTFVPYRVWYGDPTGDVQRWLTPVAPYIGEAMAHGYVGMRGGGDVSWLEDCGRDTLNTFMHYEQMFNEMASGLRIVGLCAYPLEMCDASRMIKVVRRHKFALVKEKDWTLIEPSEQKRATAAVERMNRALAERTAELQSALADLRGFSRWVTHDLRAPLRAARRFGDLLAETAMSKLDDDERQLFERIQASADRMDTLITDILAYSTAQQDALHLRPLNLEALARETWETLTGTIGARHVHLQIQPLPQAYGDKPMLRQALANLLGNAIKFTSKKSAPHVEIGALTINGECAYYVHDNGEGFDPAQADKIFGAFERLHGKSEYEGNGLGLAIVKQIITRHGGRIWAEGTPGAGATFNFTLPTAPS